MLFLRKTPKAKWQIKVENIDRDVTGKRKSKKGARKKGRIQTKQNSRLKSLKRTAEIDFRQTFHLVRLRDDTPGKLIFALLISS